MDQRWIDQFLSIITSSLGTQLMRYLHQAQVQACLASQSLSIHCQGGRTQLL